MKPDIKPNEREKRLSEQDIIASKTDQTGRITYANRTFMAISGYSEDDLLGQQHNIIRHPDMPRGIFQKMWESLKTGEEFFGFVKNLCADGGYYWVFATITPYFDVQGKLLGYYSIRRQAPQHAIEAIAPLYREMLNLEQQNPGKSAAAYSKAYLDDFTRQCGIRDCNSLMQQLFKADHAPQWRHWPEPGLIPQARPMGAT